MKIGTVDVVEGKNYCLSLNKAYLSFGISAWSDSDNKHVVFASANNRVGKGTATKTETLSIFAAGGEGMTFNNEVISIQIEEGTSATNWEPYTGGKPSPSPEYPQEIKVIEHPVVQARGRNMFDGEIDNHGNSVNPIYLSKGTYTISMLSNVDWWSNSSNKRSV